MTQKPIEVLREQLRILKRIRVCAEIWSLIGILALLGPCLGCLAVVLAGILGK